MSTQPTDPQGTNRWTKGDVTPGEDPREIDREQVDPDEVERMRQHRPVTNAEQDNVDGMGTSSSTHDPTERH